MRHSDYRPNGRVIDRAATLWDRALQNGTAGQREAFRRAIKARLMTPCMGAYSTLIGFATPAQMSDVLAFAANEAGLAYLEIAERTWMFLFPDHLAFGEDGDNEGLNHYPLSGDRWLVTTLDGPEMPKILAAVEAGTLTTLVIEPAGGAGR